MKAQEIIDSLEKGTKKIVPVRQGIYIKERGIPFDTLKNMKGKDIKIIMEKE